MDTVLSQFHAPNSLGSCLILTYHQLLGLAGECFPKGLPTKTMFAFLVSLITRTCQRVSRAPKGMRDLSRWLSNVKHGSVTWNGHVWLLQPIGSPWYKLHQYFAGCSSHYTNQNMIFYSTSVFICKFYFFIVVIRVMRGTFIITFTRFSVYGEINTCRTWNSSD